MANVQWLQGGICSGDTMSFSILKNQPLQPRAKKGIYATDLTNKKYENSPYLRKRKYC